MRFRRIVCLAAVTLVGASAACTSLLGEFEVDPSSASNGNVNATPDAAAADATALVDARIDDTDAACPSDQIFCGGRCVGPSSEHCGSCSPCPSNNAVCNIPPGDAAPFCGSTCSSSAPTLCSRTCVDTATSTDHCGSCDQACPAVDNGSPTCKGAAGCAFDCNSGFHACGSRCADDKSVATCGSSCTACVPPANANSTCDGRVCSFDCVGGYHKCPGAVGGPEVCAHNDSVTTCGSSCTPCLAPANAGPTCDGTKCGFKCNGTLAACGNACFNLTNDEAHCGSCLKQCSVGVQCINSACVVRYGFTTAFAGNSSNGTTYILAMKIDVPKAVTVTHLAALARGTGFSVVMGLYTDVGGNPGTLVVQTAATSVNATGNLAMAVTATNIGAGTYWLGAQTNSTGVFGYDSAAVPGYAYNNVGPYSGVLPVSWTAAGTYGVVSTGTENFWIVARE